ncbi:lauroyl-Kdo(2)-lipid IV(A) myristoyltransferase [Vibrio tapetis]|uniref:Lipid A biosynthesis acyltransferase n=1 Tax=Vibrio tapetis subsp. tapetis TaxID=1671868 RepID=A0A2N8ZBG6_9VIBR|nr:lauroyl-Kdo(2)-lipid IV(A) myristoyltransferase [Vibrio tapetis]SON49232.1 Lipid A biosynthesis (KDO)2-(lauroyl)-lipid IVA acyltransferase [Vibrio tapetis subsp. tapetis]
MSDNIQKQLYDPKFQWSFLHPKYWPTWLGIGFAILLAFVPFRLRDRFASWISGYFSKRNSGALRRARKNIELCYPEKTPEERQELLAKTYETAAQFFLGYAELTVRSKKYNQNRGEVFGREHLFPLLEQGEKVIALVPHCWAIDYTGMYFSSYGHDVVIMIRPQKNPIGDWLMNVQRMRYGGRIVPRDSGIKPYLRSIKDGYMAYYLPDEDHGAQNSVFVPFFGTEKATLKGFGKLAKLSRAKVVPMIPAYNAEKGKFELFILPALENFPTGDEEQDARMMNQALEELLKDRPEQYMWILNLLRTRPDGTELY